jgi:sulfatase modifying factor 1
MNTRTRNVFTWQGALVLLGLSTLCLAQVAQGPNAKQQRADEYLTHAIRSEQAGDYSEAAEQYQKALAIFPKMAVAHYRLALCYKKLGPDQRNKVIASLRDALRNAGDTFEYERSARSLFCEVSLPPLTKAQNAALEDAKAHLSQARVTDLAVIGGDASTRTDKQFHFQKALDALATLLNQQPGYFPLRRWRSEAYQGLDNPAEAYLDCREFIKGYSEIEFPDEALQAACRDVVNRKADLEPKYVKHLNSVIADAQYHAFAGTGVAETRDFKSLHAAFVWMKPGRFMMGSPKEERGRGDKDEDQVQVTLTKGFWIGQSEVTQAQWRSVMQTTPWRRKMDVKDADNYPATYVSWVDAMEFCRKLTQAEHTMARLPKAWEYTLPTEAQWEYACRAGSKTRFSFGNADSELVDYAWFYANTAFVGDQYAHAVRRRKPNPWGLYDMHGNVCEWCRDSYDNARLPGGSDPDVSSGSMMRCIRGGYWNSSHATCRSAKRTGAAETTTLGVFGFRVVVALKGVNRVVSAHDGPPPDNLRSDTP